MDSYFFLILCSECFRYFLAAHDFILYNYLSVLFPFNDSKNYEFLSTILYNMICRINDLPI